jgi:pyridoxal phosphate enzyme (YggS family)
LEQKLLPCRKLSLLKLFKLFYDKGQRLFGENKVQELCDKAAVLPKDIEWHLIGHLQSNKVKYIAPFVSLIHAVDSEKLLEEINKQAIKCKRVIPCLLQIHIAKEETKFGFSEEEVLDMLSTVSFQSFSHIEIHGLMGMATNTDNAQQIEQEFETCICFFKKSRLSISLIILTFKELSMGMSSDYRLALKHGATMIRVGSILFGER